MKTTAKTKIFLVDDEEIFQVMLSEYLVAKYGYQIKTFSSGEECLSSLHEKPDLVLLDYNLLFKNGLEILKAIKVGHPQIQVLAISGQGNVGTTMELMEHGAYSYITKSENVFEEIGEKILQMRKEAGEAKNARKEIASIFVAIAAVLIYLGFELFAKFSTP